MFMRLAKQIVLPRSWWEISLQQKRALVISHQQHSFILHSNAQTNDSRVLIFIVIFNLMKSTIPFEKSYYMSFFQCNYHNKRHGWVWIICVIIENKNIVLLQNYFFWAALVLRSLSWLAIMDPIVSKYCTLIKYTLKKQILCRKYARV